MDDSAGKISTTLELSITCKILECPGGSISAPNPQVHVYLLDRSGQKKAAELGRTELIYREYSPQFVRKILIKNYSTIQFGMVRFEIYSKNSNQSQLLHKIDFPFDYLADCQSCLASATGPVHFTVKVQKSVSCNKVATFRLSARDLQPHFKGLMDPSSSVQVYRKDSSGHLRLAHRMHQIVDGRNPKFPEISEKLASLCNGDFDREIKFELVDTHIYRDRSLGYFKTTINQLDRNRCQRQVFHLIKTNKDGSSTTTKAKAIVEKFELYERANLSRYMKAGGQLHFVVAIDFSSSNGDPNHSSGLHQLDPSGAKNNPYEETLLALTDIVKPYNGDGTFGALGFGANFEGRRRQSNHLFALNGNNSHAKVSSVEELLKAYRTMSANIIPSRIACLEPCIWLCNKTAGRYEAGLDYFVLFILTEGRISDYWQTKKAIAEASNMPLSIIMCGLGDANSDEVDNFDTLMQRKRAKPARRRVFHYVPMNRFIPITLETSKTAMWPFLHGATITTRRLLADELLEEIGDHLDSYLCEIVGNKFLLDTCRAIGEPDVICEQPKAPLYPTDLFDVMPDDSTVDVQQKDPAESTEILAPVEEHVPVNLTEVSADGNPTVTDFKRVLAFLAVFLFLVPFIVWHGAS